MKPLKLYHANLSLLLSGDLSLPAATIKEQINAILASELESSGALYNAIVQELHGAHPFCGYAIVLTYVPSCVQRF